MRWLTMFAAMVLLTLAGPGVGPAHAQSSEELDDIADLLDDTGRYLEVTTSSGLDAAIDSANGRGIAYASFTSGGSAESLADQLSERLAARSSGYRTVLVLTNDSFGAASSTVADADLEAGLDSALGDFQQGAEADGVAAFAGSLAGQTTATTTGSGSTGSSGSSGSSGGGIGLGSILLIGLLGLAGFLGFRAIRSRSKAKKQAAIDLEADRAEIKEQLRDNADHVLNLGDRVIAADKPELISTYEEASAAYQDVSHAIDGATTATEVDALDDKIDRAEWQFEVIEAELEGRPRPPSPEDLEARAKAEAAAGAARDPRAPRPASDPNSPALGRDDSVLGGGPRPRSIPQPRRRSSGGLGGLGGLGGVLGSIILGGGGLGGLGGTSRRTQRRRHSSGGFGSSSSRSSGGGIGGGVLRRGGSSRRSSGGRSLGSRRSSGGRKL